METREKLNRLSEQYSILDTIRQRFNDLRESVMTPEIKQKLEDIAAEERSYTEAITANILKFEADIRQEIIALGESVKGEHLHAIFSKPRVTWDTKGLDGFAVAHPEMEKFRKIGEPSVSIRKIG